MDTGKVAYFSDLLRWHQVWGLPTVSYAIFPFNLRECILVGHVGSGVSLLLRIVSITKNEQLSMYSNADQEIDHHDPHAHLISAFVVKGFYFTVWSCPQRKTHSIRKGLCRRLCLTHHWEVWMSGLCTSSAVYQFRLANTTDHCELKREFSVLWNK